MLYNLGSGLLLKNSVYTIFKKDVAEFSRSRVNQCLHLLLNY